MENAKKFFEEIIKTEEAKKLFASYEKPETEEDAIKTYAEVAAKFGTELSEEEIKAYLDVKKASGELDDEELSQLSGGANGECRYSFENYESCWFQDACYIMWIEYDGYYR